MSNPNWKIVRSAWLQEGGRRLDCNPYMSGALEARDTLNRLPLTERLSDVTDRIFHAGREARLWVEDASYGTAFMGSSDIRMSDFSALPLISNRQVRRNPLFTLRSGWTLITRSGTIGRMAYTRPDMDAMACSEHVLRVAPDAQRIPPGYLYAFLSSRYGVPLVVSGTYGAIIQHIEPEHIAELPVPRFEPGFEQEVGEAIDAAAAERVAASMHRRAALALFQAKIEWSQHTGPAAGTPMASSLRGRMDAFHYSPNVEAGRASLAAHCGVRLGDKVERVFEPNRGSRLKVTDPAFGVPFLSSSSVFELNPSAEYLVSRSLTPHLEGLLLSDCDVLIPRSGQLGGIIGRAVLPLPMNVGQAGSEHLVRVRCHSPSDAGYLWAVLASEPGYWALIGTAFGSSIPSLDSSLVSDLTVPWLPELDRQEIGSRAEKAVVAQNKGNELEAAAVAMLEEKIRKES
ncbi:methylation-associated defense system restriction endonuclease subunit S MAD5 [Massilia violaceinigra]|uniref:methylation-associated defense system restriction endonuclease subunit S MAD5 n=1 Tax=Massilia violaceinigra TaxID=2045208 RepID=UPI0012FE62F6|nr:restriction endonuclease subunit S [Massilia violaceinigra]